ncbi:MAG TPA: MFS transporter [Pseudonocardia sp.]|jgi:DHA2 family methylenomycin A resistance protein-like MFS transporter
MTDPAGHPTTQRRNRPPAAAARPGAVLAVMCVGMFLVLLDVTVVNVALPSIGAGLATGGDGLQWVVDGYAVAIAGLLLAGGAVGDRWGHRRVVLTGLAVFGAASAACGLAPTAGVLVAARAAQGVGAALLLPGSLAVIADAYPERAAQARALGIWAGASSLALPAGPLLGGLLVTGGGWRLVFLVNIPVVAAALVAVPLLVRATSGDPGRRADLPGLGLAALTLVSVVFVVVDAGHHGARPPGAVALLVALVAGAGLVARQRTADHPALPTDLLRRPAFLGPNVAALLMNLVVNGSLYVLTLYLQTVQHRAPLPAGLALLPMFVPLAGLAPVAGRLTARLGPRPVLVAGAVVGGLGAAGLALLGPGGDYRPVLPALLGLGIGAGLFTAPVVTAAVRAVPAWRSGLASGVNNTARQTGTALGIAVFGALTGSAADAGGFTRRLALLAGVGGGLWLVALVLVAATTGPRAGSTSSAPEVSGNG